MNNTIKKIMKKTSILLPDKVFLETKFKYNFNERLNLKNPQTFNEKIQWLKLYNRNPKYTKYVDKYLVRKYIAETIGEEYLIPLLGVYDNVEEINWDLLPNEFVLKCTHGSGCNIICTDKNKLNIKTTQKQLKKWMRTNWFWYGREWPYKNLKPRIICEKLLVDEKGEEIKDYRFFCFDGEPSFVAIDFSINDKSKTRRNLYDLDWNLMEDSISYPRELIKVIERPEKLNEMIKLSGKLAEDIPHVRVDYYYIDNKIYFGEMTLYHQAGFAKFQSHEFNKKLGTMIKLPGKYETK